MSFDLPGKIDVAQQLLRKGSLFIHLDPRRQDVVVPPWLRHQAQLVLQVGYDMPIPIDDLTVDSYGVTGTLSFSRTPFRCMIPWAAVFALVGDEGRGMVYDKDIPAEVAAEVEAETRNAKKRQAIKVPLTAASKPRRTLPEGWRVIQGGKLAAKPKKSKKRTKKSPTDGGPHAS